MQNMRFTTDPDICRASTARDDYEKIGRILGKAFAECRELDPDISFLMEHFAETGAEFIDSEFPNVDAGNCPGGGLSQGLSEGWDEAVNAKPEAA